ncbi:MAG: PQQ-dependent dehydrogenase, methanol/ethanol family [Deltaproteobacteria bacterium]|nr:PQQ-dependent dehydrogenase, methanol/ethanol family [Deltaproteobacteria bacterium]MBW2415687.1 PQQ-dependent dehydrogenase, methanol/ethanol family [Deltaproteobacteria bacterium]
MPHARLVLIGSLLAVSVAASACGDSSAPESASVPPSTAGAAGASGGDVDGARIAAADREPGNWLSHGRTYSEQRFSPLDAVNRENVSGLGLAWSVDLGTTRGVEATPIVVDGTMYVSLTWSRVLALDAATGERLWSYDPKVAGQWARNMCCDAVNRGVAVWKGSVFVGTLDGRLVSLDARTGTLNWEVQTTDPALPYAITGAPRVVKGKVVIGNGGAERGVRGYVTAYDADSGEQAWRFYTVPGDPSKGFEHPEMEVAAATWTGEWWKVGGGGTAWDAMAYDPDLDLLYIGTGNGAPWTRYERSPGGGDNLYLCAILALRPDTGELVWHYQTTPGDNWDYTSVQHMILADVQIGGRERKVLMQAPKNGFFYVLDRATGELISAEPYAVMNWASGVDPATGRPVETDHSDYSEEDRLMLPGPYGGHNWHPMSFSPRTGLVYIPALDAGFWYTRAEKFEFQPEAWNLALDMDQTIALGEEHPPDASGHLLAWDPVAQKPAWRVKHRGFWNGGVLSTAGGLVFQGTGDGRFAAYDAATGAALWEVQSTTGIMAGPVSYLAGGDQYVAVAAGFGGGVIASTRNEDAIITQYLNEGRVLAFKLGASAAMPKGTPRDNTVPAPPAQTATAEQIGQGRTLYNRHCFVCHGTSVASSLVVPDLRYASPETHAEFPEIVLGGTRVAKGMPSFGDLLRVEDLAGLHGYIVDKAHKAWQEQNQPSD